MHDSFAPILHFQFVSTSGGDTGIDHSAGPVPLGLRHILKYLTNSTSSIESIKPNKTNNVKLFTADSVEIILFFVY